MAGRISGKSVALLLALVCVAAAQTTLTPQQQVIVNHISSDSLKAHVSFLASDALEGRATPSRGLDKAADYIAAQFKKAGLEPAGEDGYFQTAIMTVREPDSAGFRMTLTLGDRIIEVQPSEAFLAPAMPTRLDNAPAIVVGPASQVSGDDVNGKVVFLENAAAARRLTGLAPALVITLARQVPSRPQVYLQDGPAPAPTLIIAKPEVVDLLRNGTGTVTIHAAAAKVRQAKVRNVAGILRGSNNELRDTFVMLTSHYDHVGMAPSGEDRIFNGANDDASGSASVMEVASALAAAPQKPARSVLFLTFFGEELGLLGSRYYSQHPLVPPAQTIADLNLEQIGRTDAPEGPQIKTASITGFDFSNVPALLAEAGSLAGIAIFKNPMNSDAYFGRSDNVNLATLGIPAHTLCVAFDFPDYHKVSDHWDKIDYDNMAAVNRAIALGVLRLASDASPPRWNESYAPAARYVEASKKLATQ